MSVDRGFTWMDDETIALIDIFRKDDIQQELNGSKRNFAVYERIARELSEVGFSRTAYQCREKIKRLRKEYQMAKYCLQHSITPKKPMKHFELVDKVFNRDAQCNNVDLSMLSSDQEDELHFTYNHDHESDASNSCTGAESNAQHIIIPGPSSHSNEDLEMCLQVKPESSPPHFQNDSDDTLLLNGDHDFDCIDKNSPLEDNESPWVPNVVLVENDLENGAPETPLDPHKSENNIDENDTMKYFQHSNQREPFLAAGSDGPPPKKLRNDSKNALFRQMLDKVTDTFVKYQEEAESRFLERVTQLEEERMRRDENMQRLWLEFEERRRKEEQEHELKMMSLFGKFVQQISASENNVSK